MDSKMDRYCYKETVRDNIYSSKNQGKIVDNKC